MPLEMLFVPGCELVVQFSMGRADALQIRKLAVPLCDGRRGDTDGHEINT